LEEFQNAGGTQEEWLQTEDARRFAEEMGIFKLEKKKFSKQAQRLQTPDDEEQSSKLALRRSYLQLFMSSKLGTNVVPGAGKRDSSIQSEFRRALIQTYNATNPKPGWGNSLWCPVLSTWVSQENITASHVFNYRHGQETMNAIFGPTAEPELFNPANGLLLSNPVEAMFDCGFCVIVPDLPVNPKVEEICAWQRSEPKEYKFKLVDLQHRNVDSVIPELGRTWRSLDGKRLEFRSNFRPRARYLYFHYCLQLLRYTWGEAHKGEILRSQEIGKKFWGSPGKYVKKNQLLGFIEEIGHEYDDLLEGAIEDTGSQRDESNDLMVLAAAKQIDFAWKQEDPEGMHIDPEAMDVDDDDDQEDEEDEDYGFGALAPK
jgi:hypothetical protein